MWGSLDHTPPGMSLRSPSELNVSEGVTDQGIVTPSRYGGGMDGFDLIDLDEQWLPKRIPPCPVCGDTDRVQYVTRGMPAGRPPKHLEDRLYFAGCIGDEWPKGDWYWPGDDRFYG